MAAGTALMVAVAAVAACGSTAATAGGGSAGAEKPDLTVAMVPATAVAGLYIAQQDGYFTAAGLHVTIVPVASGANALPSLINGAVDVDEGQWTSDLAAEATGTAKLHVLAPGNSGGTGLEEVAVPAGSPVTTARQLRGKTIAVNALNGLAELLTSNVLAAEGIRASQGHYVVIPFPAMGTALAARRVDAAFMTEPFLSQAETQHGVTPLFDIDQGAARNFPIAGYVATQTWMTRYPRTAAAFTTALTRGQRVAATDREAVEHALTHFIPAISKQTAAIMALGTYPLTITPGQLQRVADLMQDNGQLGASVRTTALAREITR